MGVEPVQAVHLVQPVDHADLAGPPRTPAAVSMIVEKITGHPAHTFAQWAEDHADDFR